jgi:CRP/FNR family transcriptional regulator
MDQSGRPAERERETELPNKSVVPVTLASVKLACSQCSLHELCLSEGLSKEELAKLDSLVGARRKLRRQQNLYRAGEPFEALYAVRTGFFKTDGPARGRPRPGDRLPDGGEILGMDGIGTEVHSCNAVALEDSEVCVIPFAQLEQLSREIQALQHNFHKVMSREIVRDHGVMMLLGTMRAEERLAAFLREPVPALHFARGYSPSEFYLRMTREEIGSYLGLEAGDGESRFLALPGRGLHRRPAEAHPPARRGRPEEAAQAPAQISRPRGSLVSATETM